MRRREIFNSKLAELDRLEGTCWVILSSDIEDLNAFCAQADCFHVAKRQYGLTQQRMRPNSAPGPVVLSTCNQCKKVRELRQERARKIKKHQNMHSLDLFSGAGFAVGFALSGIIKSKWAIDCNEPAMATFK